MALPPIFKFRNIRLRLTTTTSNNWNLIYGMVSTGASNTLPTDIFPEDVSTVILTVQVSNTAGGAVTVSSAVQNSPSIASFTEADARFLVNSYPLKENNAFDPLSGNLVMTANDQLWIRAGTVDVCDVVVSLLEIANATAN